MKIDTYLSYDFETQIYTVKQGDRVLIYTESKAEAIDTLYELNQEVSGHDNHSGDNNQINKPKPIYF